MKPRVYIETTIVSYLTAWPSRDVVDLARQQVTRDWWEHHREAFSLVVSEFVLREAGGGDPDAAKRRLDCLAGIPLLAVTPPVIQLAADILSLRLIQARAATDAYHLAIAAYHEVDFLLTWNCRHLANGRILKAVNQLLLAQGFKPPMVLTPEELPGEWS